ncbi:MAG TPA: efflux RND transporter periplasmic adaptor subunit [Bryobacteraceae bacterium]|nr:efflux RND transporter periplasmic adaptor subunit [Bryobacteraceae bacterium]
MKNTFLAGGVALALWALSTCSNRPPDPAAASPKPTNSPSDIHAVVLSPEQQASAHIETQSAVFSEQAELLRVKGRIVLADDRSWRVGVRTSGSVVAVYKGLGDAVHKGDILARYHADEVRDSRALYRRAVAELDKAKAGAAQAQRNRDRAQRMLDLKAGSQQQIEQAEQDVVAARAEVRSAEIEVDRLRDLLEDDLRVPAEPKAGRTDDLEDDVPILAPGAGYILEKNVTPGKSVDTTSVTFVIGDLSKVWMLASVRQEDLGRVRLGQAASVTLAGEDGRRLPGRITNLGQELDPVTRVMQVRIELDNRENRLRPEMLANAEIPVGGRRPTIVVPSDAVQQVGDQQVVFVQTGTGRYQVRAIRTGDTAGGRTPVLKGLKTGEAVVVHGSFVLKSQLLKSTLESE